MILDGFFGGLTTATTVGGNTKAFTNLGITLALFDGLSHLLVSNGFAEADIHKCTRFAFSVVQDVCNVNLMRRICNSYHKLFANYSH